MLILSLIQGVLKVIKVLTQRKYQDHIPYSFVYKLLCIDDKFTKPIVVFGGENAAYEVIKAIFKEFEYCKKVMKKHFNKNLIMEKKKNKFNQVTCVGYMKDSLMMTMKKLEIIVT